MTIISEFRLELLACTMKDGSVDEHTLFLLIIETLPNYYFWPQKFILALKNGRK